MKSLIYLIFFLTSISGNGQSIFERNEELFSKVERLNQSDKLEIINLFNEDFLDHTLDGGGELTGFLLNGELVKITLTIGLSYGIQTTEYYCEKGELYYVKENFSSFKYNDSLATYDYLNPELMHTGNYIFEAKKLTDLESLGHGRFEVETLDINETLWKEFIEYKGLLERKNKR